VGIFLWVPIIGMGFLACPLFWAVGYQLSPSMLFGVPLAAGLGMGASLVTARARVGRRVGAAINAFYQLSVAGGAAMMLAYAAAASGRPLYDASLLAFDRALYYDWSVYARFFAEHPNTARIVLTAYSTIMVQPLLLIGILAATNRIADLEKFIMATLVSLLLTVALFALFPATTAWSHLGLSDLEIAAYGNLPVTGESWIRDLLQIRAGHRSLPGGFGSPIIAFPSLHCASGLVYSWAGWRVRWLRPVLLVGNAMMLAATPVVGGHYIADLVGGAMVALVAILVAERSYAPLAASLAAARARWSVRPGPEGQGFSGTISSFQALLSTR
jgi:hypothetical protein